jgi:hypothetical protein
LRTAAEREVRMGLGQRYVIRARDTPCEGSLS